MIYGTIAVYPWAYKPSIFECTNYAYGRVFSTRYREVISIYRECRQTLFLLFFRLAQVSSV